MKISLLRSVFLLISASLFMLLADPQKFARNVKLRLTPVMPNLISNPVVSTERSRARLSRPRQMILDGEITAGTELIKRHKLRYLFDWFFYLEAKQHLYLLEAPVPSTEEKEAGITSVSVLHYLTNSIPFTTSGYSMRSHSTIAAQIEQDIPAVAVTRYGYPQVVGILTQRKSINIDEVNYSRVLPWVWSPRLEDQIKFTLREVKKVVAEKGVSILHTTTGGANALVIARLAAQLRIPWVYEVRGAPESTWLSKRPAEKQARAMESEFFQKSHKFELRAMKAADAVVVLSETHKAELVAKGIKDDKITVIPNAIEDEYISRRYAQNVIREELKLPCGRIIGSVSSIVDYEGFEYLIRVLPFLRKDTYVLLVGDGEARAELAQLAKSLGVDERVILPGTIDRQQAWKWYAAMDIFAIPRKDTDVTRKITPIKGVLAQALGVPVVASDLPAIREITGNVGYYFSPGDIHSLMEALEKAWDNPRRNENVDWAKQRTWRRNAQAYKALYESILSL